MKTNRQITTSSVRLIDEKGDNQGMMFLHEALSYAEDVGLDLVEVSPGVCRVLDYGKYRYQQAKANKQPKAPKLKEININTSVGEHDLQIKINRARKFLEKGHPVRIVIHQRERKITSTMKEIAEKVVSVLKVSPTAKLDKRKLILNLENKHT